MTVGSKILTISNAIIIDTKNGKFCKSDSDLGDRIFFQHCFHLTRLRKEVKRQDLENDEYFNKL